MTLLYVCVCVERQINMLVCVYIHVYLCEYRGEEERGRGTCRDRSREKQEMNEYVCLSERRTQKEQKL